MGACTSHPGPRGASILAGDMDVAAGSRSGAVGAGRWYPLFACMQPDAAERGGGEVYGASLPAAAATGCVSALVGADRVDHSTAEAGESASSPMAAQETCGGWQTLARAAAWPPTGLACRDSREQPLAPEPGTAVFYRKQASIPPWDDQIGSAARAWLQARCISGRGDRRINGARQDRLTYIAGDPGPRH
jgi:hypothetical protein